MDTNYEHILNVMSIAGAVVDVDKASEDADPWVLALALQLKIDGHAVCIVTEDIVDRSRISIATACGRLDIEWCRVREFFGYCGIAVFKEDE